MDSPSQVAGLLGAGALVRLFRYCLFCLIACLCAAIAMQALVIETFEIPSGSMAPTLRGEHRRCACPRCGHEAVVGRPSADKEGTGEPRFYRKSTCGNCGLSPLPITLGAESPGDRVVVNKAAFAVRQPSRWEVIVFRLLGSFYVKRLLGLPGEEILIHDGDLYVNGRLSRKTYAQAKDMRVVLFDQAFAPAGGWGSRWVQSVTADRETWRYANFSLDDAKCEPIRDEYTYNAGLHADSARVHDFLVEATIEVSSRAADSIRLRLCDGHDWVEVALPTGKARSVEAHSWQMSDSIVTKVEAGTGRPFALEAGRKHRVEFAFVDRRVSLVVDDRLLLEADLPEAKERGGVERPFEMDAPEGSARIHAFRLYRDVHFGQQGRHGVRGRSAQLGTDQYFFLGDNSPHSEDSRFWRVGTWPAAADLIGPVLWVRRSED
jgi:signal peptidase I